MSLIYRRLVLLTGARAQVFTMARGWECLIVGVIGRNSCRVGEYYRTRIEARNRRNQVNDEHRALVVSIEETLYPLALMIAKFDTKQLVPLPPTPPYQNPHGAFTHVRDIYKN